jgi:transcriptional regulator
MYINKLNLQSDQNIIDQYIKDNGFATIVSHSASKLMATHIPLMLQYIDNKPFLFGHIAKPNEQSSSIISEDQVLAIFMNHHAYISSSWYDHVNVPTWNYTSIHVYGQLRTLTQEEVIASMSALTDKYEKGRENSFHLSKLSDKEIAMQLRGITSFKIEVSNIQASWKMSQNRDDKNYETIISKLKASTSEMDHLIAGEMENMKSR